MLLSPAREPSSDLAVTRGSPPRGWDETVVRLGGSIFHSATWAEYQRRSRRVTPWFLSVRGQDDRVRAVGVAFLRRSRRPIASFFFRDLSLAAHPAAQDASAASALLEGCEALARRAGCGSLAIESFMSAGSPWLPSRHGYVERQRVEFSVDLSLQLDTLWRAIRKDQRERIRRLPREGVALELGSTVDDLAGLRAAREATRDKRVARGQGYDLDAGEEFYATLYHHLLDRGAARLFVARQGGAVIAALLFGVFGGRAYSMFSGSLDAGYRLGAQSGLYWLAVETFIAQGFHELNRGGVPLAAQAPDHPLHGIYQFKLRLGTTPGLCRSAWKVLSPTRQRLSHLRDWVRAALASRESTR